MDQLDDTSVLDFDPEYQNNLFKIETALQAAGALPPPRVELPNTYDAQLLRLIDSVPLE